MGGYGKCPDFWKHRQSIRGVGLRADCYRSRELEAARS